MADETTAIETTSTASQESNITLTQEEFNTKLAKEKGVGEREILKAFGLSNKDDANTLAQQFRAYRESQQTETDKTNILQQERDTLKTQYDNVISELNQYKNEKTLISKGVSPEHTEFLNFKISKLVTEDISFEQATDIFLKDNPKYLENSISFINSGTKMNNSAPPKNINEHFNAVLRAAGKR